MGQPKRTKTRAGMGAAPGDSGVHARHQDARPPMTSDVEITTADRPRTTMGFESLAFHDTIPEMERVVVEPPPPSGPNEVRKEVAKETARPRRTPRDALRVDQVRASRITVRGPVTVRPRIVDASRIPRAPLGSREAFVLQLIDGTMTTSDLVDASGIAEDELEAILARLTRLGIVAT